MGARAWGVTVCAGALVATVAHGCVEDGVSAHAICVAKPDVEDFNCEFDPASDTCLLYGVLNLLATDHYGLVLRVESGLKVRVREVPPQGETNRITFDRAEVELRSANGARFKFEDEALDGTSLPVPNPYTVTASGAVRPGEVGQVSATFIPPAYTRQLNKLFAATPAPASAQIVVAIKMKGKTDGDTSVTSGEFVWPVQVVRRSVNAADPAASCTPPTADNLCRAYLGQDDFAYICAQ